MARTDTLEEETLETVSQHLSSKVPTTSPTATAREIREELSGRRFETAAAVAVCDDRLLRGVIRHEDLLAAPNDVLASELMDDSPPTVAPGTDQEAAAWKAVLHGEATLAVVDDAGHFRGFVPPHRLLSVLLTEHDEDMARLGGFLRGTSSARTASREPVIRRLWHRLPWLVFGLAGAFAAADIVGAFETQLEETVILAFFLPGIVYMAGAVGAQTTTLIVRGLSVGVPIRDVVLRELLTGFLIGIVLALAFIPVALWRWGESDAVVAVALALFAACSTASLVAMGLPWALNRLGKDPAFGSGPSVTLIQDLISVLTYFMIATKVVS